MVDKLKGARFRLINEKLYISESAKSGDIFAENYSSFEVYHDGYRKQVNKWPINPVDVIFKDLSHRVQNEKLNIADFGCGDAILAQKLVTATVHSFDIVAANDRVTACDMRNTNLLTNSVDVAVFCLSLMSSCVSDCIIEANRVLKNGGIMKIADVESRFECVDQFINDMTSFGFKLISKDYSCNIFLFLDFRKFSSISVSKKLPNVSLKPCMYKKR
ncbi:hypothetical protein AAG570_008306 [Ranatra chinensis]|uniref:Ribosomal RNA-processing protein 8 n=1 Tax=Ranatra chinensis TaxID=642074 RepID=A0ABD0XSS9_9HEMI